MGREVAMLTQFESDGISVVPGAIGLEALDEIREWILQALDGLTNLDLEPDFEERETQTRKLRRLYWSAPKFWDRIIHSSNIYQIAEAAVGGTPTLIYHAVFLKQPKVGSQVAFHQDQGLWSVDYPDAVSIWIAVDKADRSNGCLVGYPGSHIGGLLPHEAVSDHPWHDGINDAHRSGLKMAQYELDPGDAAVWHRYFIHGSGANSSDRSRLGVVFVFADGSRPEFTARDRAVF